MAYPFAITRHAWNGREAGGHERLCHRVRVLFAFLSFHLHRRIRYEPFGPWAHFPQRSSSSSTASVQDQNDEVTHREPKAPEHAGAVVDEWASDEDEGPGLTPSIPAQRLTRNMASYCASLGVQPE
jgi:hypothetical protein